MGPPRHNGRVRQQQCRNQGLGGLGQFTVAVQDDHLGGTGVPAHAQLGVQAGGLIRGMRHVHDDPAGVLVAREVRGLDRHFRVARAGQDHQREHAAQRNHTVFVPQRVQLLLDGRCGGVFHLYDHGRLQTRPSRAMS